jgi:hypothetical protein
VKATLYLRFLAASVLLALAGCGKMAELEPVKGQPLPVKPLMARATPTPNELLTPPAYANPDRVDELMKKSTPRQSDPFDLPPPTGQAPTLTVEELSNETTNEVGPATPR